MVVKEFRSPVPERRLVLVAFQNELRAATQPIALPKILSDTPHKKVRLLPRRLENPCQHCCGSGFSVRSADDDRMLPRQKHFLQYLRQRAIWGFSVEHFFDLGISARDDVADD